MMVAKLSFAAWGSLRLMFMRAATLRSFLLATASLSLMACGPFRPPSFEKTVSLGRDGSACVTSIQGTWPNLPHNPLQWVYGGRTALTVTLQSPGSGGRYVADQIVVYYTWPNSSPFNVRGLNGTLQFQSDSVDLDLTQTLDGSTKPLEINGHYAISNPGGCNEK